MIEQLEMYLAGAWVGSSAGGMLESVNPATGSTWARFPDASAEDVDRAVRAAHAAMFEGPWSRMNATARGKTLYRIAELLDRDAPLIAQIETRDTGKLIRETEAQIRYIAEFYRYFGGLADKVEGQTFPVDKPGHFVFTVREPIGVVAAIVPWNSQMFLSAIKIAPALAAGNSVVLKASEHAPAPLIAFARVIEEAGVPPGVFNIVTGTGAVCGNALTRHPLVARICFTGGDVAARQIVRNSAENFAVTTLELGGKSPIIIFDDTDVTTAVNGIVSAIFAASGQSCVAGSRVYVQRGIYDAVVQAVCARARTIVVGDPAKRETEMGPLATKRQLDTTLEILAQAVEAGATVLEGGVPPSDGGGGFFIRPTVLACPDKDNVAVSHEFFSPVLCVFSFDSEDEAVIAANDSIYGLAAGVFTRDGGRALRVMKRLQAGTVFINNYRAISPMVPFGGLKASGLAREGGQESILDYTRPKTVWYNTSNAPIEDPFVMR